jgi:hypothetical protein
LRSILARLRLPRLKKADEKQLGRTGFNGEHTAIYQQILRPLLVQTFGKPAELVDAAMHNYVLSFETCGIDAPTRELIEQLKPILQTPMTDRLAGSGRSWSDEETLPMIAAFARIFQRYHFEETVAEPPAEQRSYIVIGEYHSAA